MVTLVEWFGHTLLLVRGLRDKNRPFGSKLPKSAKFGPDVVYIILFQNFWGAETGDPQNGRKSQFSKWPPHAALASESQELKRL